MTKYRGNYEEFENLVVTMKFDLGMIPILLAATGVEKSSAWTAFVPWLGIN